MSAAFGEQNLPREFIVLLLTLTCRSLAALRILHHPRPGNRLVLGTEDHGGVRAFSVQPLPTPLLLAVVGSLVEAVALVQRKSFPFTANMQCLSFDVACSRQGYVRRYHSRDAHTLT